MKKLIAFTDIIGTALIIILSILDHLIGFGDKLYFVLLIIGIILLVPVTVREAYSVMKMKKDENK
ncbi:MAG: hypothetical protein IJX24_03525 [Oscillospiraceae bacterium]|nr:hypothetical protein [Oscillospiraceae bacterium]